MTGETAELAPRVILDCDPGHDDAIAIVVAAHAASSLGITTVAGNAPLDQTTHNVSSCASCSAIDVAVHAGAERPLARRARPPRTSTARAASTAPTSPSRSAAGLRRRRRVHHRDVPE